MDGQTLTQLAVFIGLGITVFILVGVANRLLSLVNSIVRRTIINRVSGATERRTEPNSDGSKTDADSP